MKRHSAWVRITHWVNALLVVLLLGTGLNIFNAHPALYWGPKGTNVDTEGRWLAIGALGPRGMVMIGDTNFDTTGVLGLSAGQSGSLQNIAFPHWATIPSGRDLGLARNWHFAAAWLLIVNGLVYLAYGVFSGHFRRRLLPGATELQPGNIGHDIVEHLKLRFPKGEAALRYQVLQKIAYSGAALVLLPLMVLSGLGMAPGMDASWPWVVDLFGGRQSARSVHFVVTNLVVLFILVHLLMLVLAGPFKLTRGMITGWQRVESGT
ncbi:cytochrome b/b6 domain-containing protein [Polymorphobacter sp.]|uniref:cytochrome b/b6 domain-containing protein n=1 Tax=Polymorphobacter sp. TaxID=1909290 RepID=UPI003F6E845D